MTVEESKTLSYLLRHGAKKHHLKMSEDGYVSVNDLLDNHLMKSFKMTFDHLCTIIDKDVKNRFLLKKIGNLYYIRANQGHSISQGKEITDEKIFTVITTPLKICFHGTYGRFLDSIQKEGIKIMKRKHIHMASSYLAKSGQRIDCDVLIHINMEKAMNDGMKFFLSENNVILTRGLGGVIDPKYFVKIEKKTIP
jgi:2'-phosphotransferase